MAKHSWKELLSTLRGLLQEPSKGTPSYHPVDPVLQAGVVLLDDVVDELTQVESAKNVAEAQVRTLRTQLEDFAYGRVAAVKPWTLSGMKKLSKRERKILTAYQDEIEYHNQQVKDIANTVLESIGAQSTVSHYSPILETSLRPGDVPVKKTY